MFSKTRKKLTLFFAALMFLFLIAFNGISYFILSSIIYSDREKEIQMLAEREAERHKKDFIVTEKKGEDSNPNDHSLRVRKARNVERPEQGEAFRKGELSPRPVLRPFTLVLDSNGQLLNGEYPLELNMNQEIQRLKDWIPSAGEIRYDTVLNENGQKMNLMFSGRAIYRQEQYLGSVYTGADISQQTEILQQLMLVLAAISVLFLLLSVFLGYVMSEKAMKPIIRAFTKQKQFVADASHELRTPITVIQSSLEVLEEEEREHLQPFSKQVLVDLKDEVKRMSALVSHMLTLARADSSEYVLRLDSFSMNEELEKCFRKVLPLVEAKNQHVHLKAEPRLEVRADRERILQLLMILIDNAIQYTPNEGTIEISAEAQNRLLVLAVSDTGVGIAKEQQKEIFERFYRGDPSRSRAEGNLGLGLSIAKWIAMSHGGTIHVQSETGKGSTFTVTLPILQLNS